MTDVIGEMLNDTSKDMRYKRIFIYDIDPVSIICIRCRRSNSSHRT